MRNFIVVCAALIVGVVVAPPAKAAPKDKPNFGYCNPGTCGPNGGTKTRDTTKCSPQNCKKKDSSSR